jgi:hypothetical protein
MEFIQGKTTIAEASRAFDVYPAEIEGWVDEAKRGVENALRAKPLDIKEEYYHAALPRAKWIGGEGHPNDQVAVCASATV